MAGREVLGAVFGVLVGCSSETTVVVPNCGPGTVAKDGVCVPTVDSAVFVDTSTSDTSMLDSDIGYTDSASGTDGDTAVDTAAPDAVSWPIEPCPTFSTPDGGPVVNRANCAKDVICPGFTPGYCPIKCDATASTLWLWNANTEWYIRLPEAKDAPTCASPCADKNGVRGFNIALYQPKRHIHMRVQPPWEIQDLALDACPIPLKGTQCLDTEGRDENHRVFVFTRDPNAPARNLYIKHVNTVPATLCP